MLGVCRPRMRSLRCNWFRWWDRHWNSCMLGNRRLWRLGWYRGRRGRRGNEGRRRGGRRWWQGRRCARRDGRNLSRLEIRPRGWNPCRILRMGEHHRWWGWAERTYRSGNSVWCRMRDGRGCRPGCRCPGRRRVLRGRGCGRSWTRHGHWRGCCRRRRWGRNRCRRWGRSRRNCWDNRARYRSCRWLRRSRRRARQISRGCRR